MRLLTGLVIVALAATAASAQGQPGPTPSKADIQKVLEAGIAHRNAGNWERYVENYMPDATVMSSTGRMERGRAEMLKGLQEMFASGVYKGVQTTVTVESIQAIAPGAVVADTSWELSNIPGGGTRKGRSIAVLVKSGESWKIAAERSMVPTPAGAIKPRE